MIFTFLLDLGITSFNNREIARHNHLISRYFSNIIGIKMTLGFFYAIICICGSLFMGYSWAQISLLIILIFNQFLSSFILYLRSNINGLLMFISDSILSVLDKALMILFLSILLWTNITGGIFKIEWFVYSQTAAYMITAITALVLVIKNCNYFSPRFDIKYLILILRKSLPFSVLALLMMLYNRIEPVLLERLLPDGKVQAGIYAQGFRILEVLSNFAYLFPVLLLPIFSKMLKTRENMNELVSMAGSIMILPSIALATACSFYGKEIMNSLYHQQESGAIFSVLIWGFAGISTTYLYGTLLTANGNLKQLNIMAASAVVLNICLNIYLIPRFKSQGAAYSSFITQCLTGAIQMVMAYKILMLQKDVKRILKVILWFVIFISSALLVKSTFNNWIFGLISIPVIGLMLIFILQLIKTKEIVMLIFSVKTNK